MSTTVDNGRFPVALQEVLKDALQREEDASKLENLAAAVLGRLLDVPILVARSGFQHGGDAGPSGRQGRTFRLEMKKYSDSTSLRDRELLGEMDQALSRSEDMEAWILVSTRAVPEQLADDLRKKGERIGVPVVILDWMADGPAPLAALCAFAPDLVESLYSPSAGAAARALYGTEGALEQIQRDLQSWCLGFEECRRRSHEQLVEVWTKPRAAIALFGQNAAGGAVDRRIKRVAVRAELDRWWNDCSPAGAPAVVTGLDGVGKTWAALEWFADSVHRQPIVLLVPSSSATKIGASEVALKEFFAERLYELTGARTREHWLRRLERLLKRPLHEGPVLTVLLDGLNQEPSVPWELVLQGLQRDAFVGRVRVVLTTRTHHFANKLARLCSLIDQPAQVPVGVYDIAPGGELDTMLASEGLIRSDLHQDLLELARTPRLFSLVIRFRERLIDASQVTIHHLLWEYGKERVGRSFTDSEWQEWLREVADGYRRGVKEVTEKGLADLAGRRDLLPSDVYRRLSDIIDGRFMSAGPNGKLRFTLPAIAHALGTALLAQVESCGSESAEAELDAWLDPIAGLDERAEILRAAVAILVAKGEGFSSPIGGALVAAWLQTQNITDQHRRELAALAPELPRALIDAIERSVAPAHTSARTWAANALRAIPRTNVRARELIIASSRKWFCEISRDVGGYSDAQFAERHRQILRDRIGTQMPGPVTVLGVDLSLVDSTDGTLQTLAPSLLEGLPLAQAVSVFEAAAVALATARQSDGWDGLKWLCVLNEGDRAEMITAIRRQAAEVSNRKPEAGVHPDVRARAASLLLRLTGEEVDEVAAADLKPRLDQGFDYKDYLVNPGASLFPLERRHAAEVLSSADVTLLHRVIRTSQFWVDPAFEAPAPFIEELTEAARAIRVETLDRHAANTTEDHSLEQIEPVLARCSPECLADLVRRKLQRIGDCTEEARYWSAVRATEHLVLAGPKEASAAESLRSRGRNPDASRELFAATQLLPLEIHGKPALEQFSCVIEAGLKFVSIDLAHVLKPPSEPDLDKLIARYGESGLQQRHSLLSLMALTKVSLSEGAWTSIEAIARDSAANDRGLAFKILASADCDRFARALLAWDWSWSPSQDYLVNHNGSGALIEGAARIPFDRVASRIGPWRVLEAARRRGGEATEVRMAAAIVASVLRADRLAVPDLGVVLSVERFAGRSDPFQVSMEMIEEPDRDPHVAMKELMDSDTHLNAFRRAAETATQRIEAAQAGGASLYLADLEPDDFETVIDAAPEMLDVWLEGADAVTSDFTRRVQLAEGAYLALCEGLLRRMPEQGGVLWRALRKVLVVRYIGVGGVDEMLHMIFRAPSSPTVDELREHVLTIEQCHTDRDLLDVAIAASANGHSEWLARVIASDGSAPEQWRQRRGVVLDGFRARNVLPVPEAWPDRELRTSREEIQVQSARSRSDEACARTWWRQFVSAPDGVTAYAAWILFLRSADRRAWTWMGEDIGGAADGSDWWRLKMAHFAVNRSVLKRAMEKREREYESRFLRRAIISGLGPWRQLQM